MSSSTPAAERAGRREWVGLAVLALPCLLYSMDLTVLYLAVPALSADLEPSSAQLLWITDVYGFLLAGLLITMGTVGDRIGRRRLLLLGATAFGAASVLAAFSTSAELLIAARALLGVAAATLAPSTLSLIRNMFADERQRTYAIGVWIMSFSVGAAIGPLIGGALLEFFWWGSVFLIAVPVMVLLLVLGPVLLPEYRDPEAGRLDLLSAALSLIAMLALIYGLKQIAEVGLDSRAAAAIVGGVVVGILFLRRQRVLPYPLIDLRLFRAPAFSTSVAAMCVAVFVVGGMFFFIAQYLQLVLGQGPLEAGLWLLPSTAGLIVGSLVAPLLVGRVAAASVVAGGLGLAAVGAAILTGIGGGDGLAIAVVGSSVIGLGAGAVGTLATDLVVGTAPRARAGAASAISETGAELGGALGVAILGSVGTAVYRSQMDDSVPAGVPPAAVETARDTLGGASEVATALPDALGSALFGAAREAFTDGLQLAAVVTAIVVAALAVGSAVVLRRVRAPTGALAADQE